MDAILSQHQCVKGNSSAVTKKSAKKDRVSWWRHQMEHFPRYWPFVRVPAQRPVTRSFNVFFDLRLNKRLSKQSWGWWFETLPCPLWRQCNVMQVTVNPYLMKCPDFHQLKTHTYAVIPSYPGYCREGHWISMGSPEILWVTWQAHYNDVITSAMASQITSISIVGPTVGSGADQRKRQSSATLAFVWGIHRWPMNYPHKRPVTRKISIWWLHHAAIII